MIKLICIIRYMVCSFLCHIRFGKRISIGITKSMNSIPKIYLSKKGRIKIDKHCAFENIIMAVAQDGSIEVGTNVSFGENIMIVARKGIEIGNECIFAPNVVVYDHDHCYNHSGYTSGYRADKIKIGNHVWIGANVTILKGSTIGDNSIIGAGTVIKGNIPKNTIVYAKQNYALKELN